MQTSSATAINTRRIAKNKDTQLAGRCPGIGRDDRLEEEAAGEAEDQDDARQEQRPGSGASMRPRMPWPSGS